MKKISYYILVIIILGAGVVSFWVYGKYFKKEAANELLFNVARGDIQEVVKVRGEIAAQKEFDLEFPFSGTVDKIFVKEGQQVSQGDQLMKLDATDFELEVQKLEAGLNQKKANLEKLLAGATVEDIQISETKVSGAQSSLEDAKKNLINKLLDAYTKSEDAIRAKADQLINNPLTSSPQLSFTINDFQLENDIEWSRFVLENSLKAWKSSLDKLTTESDFSAYLSEADNNLSQVKLFLDKLALAVNNPANAALNSSISQTTFSTWQTNISTARTNVNTAVTNLSTADEKFKTAQSSLRLAEDELAYKKAGSRKEEIDIAKAQIAEIESQISIAKEKIRKSVLYSPASGKITKIFIEKGEVFKQGTATISLSSFGYKAQADVSELEIGKIKAVNGDNVIIKLDAFFGQEFSGKVALIEPKEIIKEGDVYYRVNVSLDGKNENIRPGMSADLIILGLLKENVLKIPEFIIYQKDNKKFVKLIEAGVQKEVEIETGISDGEFIEIIKGLSEGQTATISSE